MSRTRLIPIMLVCHFQCESVFKTFTTFVTQTDEEWSLLGWRCQRTVTALLCSSSPHFPSLVLISWIHSLPLLPSLCHLHLFITSSSWQMRLAPDFKLCCIKGTCPRGPGQEMTPEPSPVSPLCLLVYYCVGFGWGRLDVTHRFLSVLSRSEISLGRIINHSGETLFS